MIRREETRQTVHLQDDQCTFRFERLRPGALLVTISGYDRGTFGTAALDELTAEKGRYAPLTLFVDAADARGATWEVSQQWTSWFTANRAGLARVHVLVGSKYLHLTISVAKELSRTGDLIAIYADRDRFEDAVRKLVPTWPGPRLNGKDGGS